MVICYHDFIVVYHYDVIWSSVGRIIKNIYCADIDNLKYYFMDLWAYIRWIYVYDPWVSALLDTVPRIV